MKLATGLGEVEETVPERLKFVVIFCAIDLKFPLCFDTVPVDDDVTIAYSPDDEISVRAYQRTKK